MTQEKIRRDSKALKPDFCPVCNQQIKWILNLPIEVNGKTHLKVHLDNCSMGRF